MVAFDLVCRWAFFGRTLDNIRINSPLRKELNFAQLACFGLEHSDKLFADNRSFAIWISYSFERTQERFGGVHSDQLYFKLPPERFDYLLRFPFSQHAVVDENARQLRANRSLQQSRRYSRIDPTAQGKKYVASADLIADTLNQIVDNRAGSPVSGAPAHAKYKITQNRCAERRMRNFRVKLNRVDTPRIVGKGSERRIIGPANGTGAFRQPFDTVTVTH